MMLLPVLLLRPLIASARLDCIIKPVILCVGLFSVAFRLGVFTSSDSVVFTLRVCPGNTFGGRNTAAILITWRGVSRSVCLSTDRSVSAIASQLCKTRSKLHWHVAEIKRMVQPMSTECYCNHVRVLASHGPAHEHCSINMGWSITFGLN